MTNFCKRLTPTPFQVMSNTQSLMTNTSVGQFFFGLHHMPFCRTESDLYFNQIWYIISSRFLDEAKSHGAGRLLINQSSFCFMQGKATVYISYLGFERPLAPSGHL